MLAETGGGAERLGLGDGDEDDAEDDRLDIGRTCRGGDKARESSGGVVLDEGRVKALSAFRAGIRLRECCCGDMGRGLGWVPGPSLSNRGVLDLRRGTLLEDERRGDEGIESLTSESREVRRDGVGVGGEGVSGEEGKRYVARSGRCVSARGPIKQKDADIYGRVGGGFSKEDGARQDVKKGETHRGRWYYRMALPHGCFAGGGNV